MDALPELTSDLPADLLLRLLPLHLRPSAPLHAFPGRRVIATE